MLEFLSHVEAATQEQPASQRSEGTCAQLGLHPALSLMPLLWRPKEKAGAAEVLQEARKRVSADECAHNLLPDRGSGSLSPAPCVRGRSRAVARLVLGSCSRSTDGVHE